MSSRAAKRPELLAISPILLFDRAALFARKIIVCDCVRQARSYFHVSIAQQFTFQFAAFLATSLRAIGADSTRFPLHSFRRRGATFTFECGILAELIKLQGDWKSDAYFVYLETSDPQKRAAVVAMAENLQSLRLIPPTLEVSEFIVFSSFVAVLFFVGLTIKLHISQTLMLSVFEWQTITTFKFKIRVNGKNI